MYQVGDYVVKSNSGICRIEDILPLDEWDAEKEKLYYLLVPLADNKMKIYVPAKNENPDLRPALKEEEAWEIIHRVPDIEEANILNERQREKEYKDAVRSCDPEHLVSILKTMYVRKRKRNLQGKKCTAIDERYFKLAENTLYSELAFAIGRDKDEIYDIITETIRQEQQRK